MHIHPLEDWQHDHDFGFVHEHGERRTTQVFWLTTVTMVVEIAAGTLSGSMALLADGWHMGTHAAAFAIAIFAYRYGRRHARNARFSFGTGKVTVLGGFASAVALAVVALMMALESVQRLVEPRAIHFDEAIAVAVLGLTVNVVSAFLLQHPGGHSHGHDHGHRHDHQHDHNLRAAYVHVLADALTSLLAIAALVTGKFLGWVWMDPMMGCVGAVIIAWWSYGLLTRTGAILLDGDVEEGEREAIRRAIEDRADDRVVDLHVWKVGPHDTAAIISVVTSSPRAPAYYKGLLAGVPGLSHVSVEVNPCNGDPCRAPETGPVQEDAD